MGGPRLDPSVWNLGVPMLAIAACGPIVALGETESTSAESADPSDSQTDDDDDDGPQTMTSPSTTMPGTVTVSTTLPTECNYDTDCPPGYRCQYGQCYYDGYCQDGTCCSPECGWYEECYSHYGCPVAYECRYYSCQPLIAETVCESVPFGIGFEIPNTSQSVVSLAFIESDGVPGRELLIGGDGGLVLARIDGSSAQLDLDSLPFDLRVRDIDGDGDEDISFVDYNDLRPKLLLNDGMWTQITLEGASAEEVALLDVQGDGALDVVGVSSNEGVNLWVQEGPTQWSGPTYIWEQSWVIANGDLDADGLEDAVVHGYSTNALSLGLANPTYLQHAIDSNFRRLAVGNFDGSGTPDVITTEGVNNGTIATTFPGPVLDFAGWYSSWWPWRVDMIRTADMNGDGFTDILGGSSTLTIAWGGPEPDGIVCVSTVPTEYSPYFVAGGDMSGDGRADIAVSDGMTVYVMLRTD